MTLFNFTIGKDSFALAGGLAFSNLTIEEINSGTHKGKLSIKNKASGEYYAVIDNLQT